ncbi:DUF3558 domain-containing protein [Nocardia sp. NPDC058176]|uniref:DUF3558 domain-containing protein n=1 Tax=Nocardia sp. NPDC058176 TaxID=3346368 RepID=UPI0036DC9D8B
MNRQSIVWHALAGLVAFSLVTGCGSGDPAPTPSAGPSNGVGSPTSVTVRPTLTDAKLQPPEQDNRYTNAGGRPRVLVDPCTWIPDDTISGLGLDPATRKRGTDLVAEYTFLTCGFASAPTQALWTVQIDSGNVSLDEVRQKYEGRFENIDVNGRPSVMTVKNGDATCAVDMRTSVGYFGVEAALEFAAEPGAIAPCDKAIEFARGLEPVIGAGN